MASSNPEPLQTSKYHSRTRRNPRAAIADATLMETVARDRIPIVGRVAAGFVLIQAIFSLCLAVYANGDFRYYLFAVGGFAFVASALLWYLTDIVYRTLEHTAIKYSRAISLALLLILVFDFFGLIREMYVMHFVYHQLPRWLVCHVIIKFTSLWTMLKFHHRLGNLKHAMARKNQLQIEALSAPSNDINSSALDTEGVNPKVNPDVSESQ